AQRQKLLVVAASAIDPPGTRRQVRCAATEGDGAQERRLSPCATGFVGAEQRRRFRRRVWPRNAEPRKFVGARLGRAAPWPIGPRIGREDLVATCGTCGKGLQPRRADATSVFLPALEQIAEAKRREMEVLQGDLAIDATRRGRQRPGDS